MFPGGLFVDAGGDSAGAGQREQDGNAMFHVQLPLWMVNRENAKGSGGRIIGQRLVFEFTLRLNSCR
jgi:hypothetical protein